MLQYFGRLVDFRTGLVLGVVVDAFADQVVGLLLPSREIPLARAYGVAIHQYLSRPELECVWESWGAEF